MTGKQPGERIDVLVPTALWRPGPAGPRPGTADTTAGASGTPATQAGVSGRGSGGMHGVAGRQPPLPASPASPLPPPRPLVDSVGDIAGLRPRRRWRDGGEVPGVDVDLIDALPRHDDPATGQQASWPTAAAWLRAGRTAATRRPRLAVLSMFVRWWAATAPGAGLWQVTEDVLVAYADELGTGTGRAAELTRRGRALADATVKRHISEQHHRRGVGRMALVIRCAPRSSAPASSRVQGALAAVVALGGDRGGVPEQFLDVF
ncbi:hypothetical protein ACWCOT_46160 [Nonomuraea bangladeshensis]